MNYETKRNVFNDLLEELADAYIALDGEGIGKELTNEDKQAYLKDYDAALPDELPTIPEVVDEFIRGWGYATLVMIFSQAKHLSAFAPTEREQHGWQWIVDNEDEFARAWVLGVWRVEETGEIVKVEDKK